MYVIHVNRQIIRGSLDLFLHRLYTKFCENRWEVHGKGCVQLCTFPGLAGGRADRSGK